MNSPQSVMALSMRLTNFLPPTIHRSYKVFIDYFHGELSNQGILAGAYMVYGWMPTMLRIKGPLEPIFELVRAGRQGTVDPKTLSDCSKSLNNSLVGTTKLLHFVSPNIYPIWDSRVYRALFSKHPHRYRLEDSSIYFDFLDWLREFESLLEFPSIKDLFEGEAGYAVSNKRVGEAILYSLGAKPRKSTS